MLEWYVEENAYQGGSMKRMTKKVLSILLSLALIVSVSGFGISMPEEASAQTLSELNSELSQVDAELEKLKQQSENTEEYLRVLNKRLDNLKKQYTIIKNEVVKTNNRISELQNSIKNNKESITKVRAKLKDLEEESEILNEKFDSTRTEYYLRIRALYVSGDMSSSLGFILDSDGLSQLLARFEMISAVTRRDGILMKIVKQQCNEIIQNQKELKENEELLVKTQKVLESDTKNLKVQKTNLASQQEEMEEKQAQIEAQQQDANKVLDSIYSNTETYEKKHDQIMQEIDEAIAKADEKYSPTTTKPTTKPTTTTTTTTTTSPDDSDNSHESTTTTTTTTTTQPTTKPSTGKLSMTYPCPAYKTITCAFGAYSGHSGCDFATGGKVNQKVVAAESGTVIVSQDLKNADGTYRSYGRYIVIRHDKTNSRGQTVYTLYAHNNSRSVKAGDYVSKGQQIALSGSTGNSTGPHLHFEVRVGGSSQSYAVDPELYLP